MTSITNNGADGALFPAGSLIFSPGVQRLMKEGSLDPMPFVQRHLRGDWGDVTASRRQENGDAVLWIKGGRIASAYDASPDLRIFVFTRSDRSATHVVVSTET